MTKALLCTNRGNAAMPTDRFINLIGVTLPSATEAPAQITAQEAFTLSKLGARKISGTGSSNVVKIRKNEADGNQSVTLGSGDATAEDGSNTDAFAVNDRLALNFTDNGTDPLYAWAKANIEFASGHGNIHGSMTAGGLSLSAVGFLSFFGPCNRVSGGTSETNASIRNRAYTSLASWQVNVTANTSTGTHTITGRKNLASDATVQISIGAGLTGVFEQTGLGYALADADLFCVVFDDAADGAITVTDVTGVFKSTANKSDVISGQNSGVSFSALASAIYLPLGTGLSSSFGFTEAQARVKPGFAGSATRLRVRVSANTLTGDMTVNLLKNGSSVMSVTITAGTTSTWFEDTSTSVSFSDTDELSYELNGGTSGAASICSITTTLEDTTAAAAGQPIRLRHAQIPGMRTGRAHGGAGFY